MSIKAKIEALLYVTDKPVKAPALAKMLGEDVQTVRQALLELIHEYETRAGALEIADEDGYILQVKDEYASVVEEFSPIEMPLGVIRTLSAIAIKQPISQSEIIRIRGASAYDHIKDLVSRQLVAKKEEGGRSPTLSTTKRFQEYFKLSKDGKSLRQYLRRQAKKLEQQGDGESNEPLVQQLPLNYDLLGDAASNTAEFSWPTMDESAGIFAAGEQQAEQPSTDPEDIKSEAEITEAVVEPEEVLVEQPADPEVEQPAGIDAAIPAIMKQEAGQPNNLSPDPNIGMDMGLGEPTNAGL